MTSNPPPRTLAIALDPYGPKSEYGSFQYEQEIFDAVIDGVTGLGREICAHNPDDLLELHEKDHGKILPQDPVIGAWLFKESNPEAALTRYAPTGGKQMSAVQDRGDGWQYAPDAHVQLRGELVEWLDEWQIIGPGGLRGATVGHATVRAVMGALRELLKLGPGERWTAVYDDEGRFVTKLMQVNEKGNGSREVVSEEEARKRGQERAWGGLVRFWRKNPDGKAKDARQSLHSSLKRYATPEVIAKARESARLAA